MSTTSIVKGIARSIAKGIVKGGLALGFDPLDPKWGGLFITDADTQVFSDYEAPALDFNPSTRIWEPEFGPTPTYENGATGVPGTYFDEDGILQVAAVNEPRITTENGVTGALIEPEAEQLISTDWDDWSASGGMVSTPSGTYAGQDAIHLENTGSSSFYSESFTPPNGVVCTFSVWVRKLDAQVVDLRLYVGASFAYVSVTEEWTRVAYSFTGGGVSTEARIRIATTGGVVEVAMPQVEVGTVPTSFIPNVTGSPVTRAADIPRILDTSEILTGVCSVYMEFVAREAISSAERIIVDGNATDSFAYIVATEAGAKAYDGSAKSYPAFDDLGNGVSKLFGSFGIPTWDLYADGTESAGLPISSGLIGLSSQINIGCDASGASQLNGILTRLIVWPKLQADL